MYISEIRIKNYRSWKDAKIKIPYDKERGRTITLFSGKIAAGKTSLFNAIGWCLTGKESQELLGSNSHEKGIPRDAEYDKDENIQVSVSLDIETPENEDRKRIIIERKEWFKKYVKDPISSEVKIHLYGAGGDLRILSSNDNYEKMQIENILKEMFPERLAKFNFFDGEFLVQTYSERGADIEEALKGMFRIGALSNLKRALEQVYEVYKGSLKKMTNNQKLKKLFQNLDDKKMSKIVCKVKCNLLMLKFIFWRIKLRILRMS